MGNTPTLVAGSNIITGFAASVVIPAWSSCLFGDQKFIAITVTSDPTPTLPAGWDVLIDNLAIGTNVGANRRFYLIEQIAAGADAGFTLNFTGTTNYGVTHFAVRDGEYLLLENAARLAAAVTGETGTSLAAPSINCDAGSLYLGHFCVASSTTTVVPTTPAGTTLVDSQAASGGVGHNTTLVQEARSTAGAVQRTSTGVANRWTATGIHIPPRGRNRHFFGA